MKKKTVKSTTNENSLLVIAGGSYKEKSVAMNQSKLIRILSELFDEIQCITFCDPEYLDILNKYNLLSPEYIYNLKKYQNGLLDFIINQVVVTKKILHINSKFNFDIALFTMGQDLQFLPIFISKILGKKVVIRSSGRPTNIMKNNYKNKSNMRSHVFKLIEEVNYRLANIILTECDYAVIDNDFEKYNKAHVANLFVDTEKFRKEKTLSSRNYNIGYIGSFNEIKGILRYIESIPQILAFNSNIKIFIAGNGRLINEVITAVNNLNCENIAYRDWIPHNELPSYLNDLQLLVVPSLKEGLPNMIIEGIACGTIVLATPVGAIPALITDEKTGFIMENNSPTCIAKNVLRVLNHPDLESIATNARIRVEEDFSFENTVIKYKTIFTDKSL